MDLRVALARNYLGDDGDSQVMGLATISDQKLSAPGFPD